MVEPFFRDVDNEINGLISIIIHFFFICVERGWCNVNAEHIQFLFQEVGVVLDHFKMEGLVYRKWAEKTAYASHS